MDDILYLEVDEEIPSVIEKLRKQPTDDVVLVVPTGAALLSSVVNVKLLKRSAEKEKKRLAVVTTDPIGRHIATQVGVPVYVSVKDRRTFEPPRASAPSVESEEMDLREPDRADDAGVPTSFLPVVGVSFVESAVPSRCSPANVLPVASFTNCLDVSTVAASLVWYGSVATVTSTITRG